VPCTGIVAQPPDAVMAAAVRIKLEKTMEMALWEKLLLGALGLLVLFMFRPGIKAAMEMSRNAEHKDWAGLLLPLGAVVLFVLLLIAAV